MPDTKGWPSVQVLKIARSDGVLSLSGEIDLSVAEDVRAALVDASDAGIRVIDVSEVTFDRLMVASQYFFEFEESVLSYDPTGAPLFPALA